MSDYYVDTLRPYLGDPAKAGSDGWYPYRCPFHKDGNERRPSFYLNGDNGVSFCHTCNEAWGIPRLLKLLNAPRRVIDLAVRAMPDTRPKSHKIKMRKGLLEIPSIPEGILGIFDFTPIELVEKGFDEALLIDYEVGFDREHDRITYPIRDHKGRLVGISGRASWGYKTYDEREFKKFVSEDEKVPKGLSDKGWCVWNLDRIYPRAMSGKNIDQLIIVEGFKACLWMIQSGFPNTVALMGSYLTESQARLLERVSSKFIVFLDSNKAGQNGTDRIIYRLGKSSEIRLTEYPRRGNLQPDDLVNEDVQHVINSTHLPCQKRIKNGLR